MHPVWLCTLFTHIEYLYFACRTTTLLHPAMKHLYQIFRNYLYLFSYSQALFNSVAFKHRPWALTEVILVTAPNVVGGEINL